MITPRKVPLFLDKPLQVLYWDLPDFLFLITVLFYGMLKSFWIGVAGYLVYRVYREIKRHYNRGFIKHGLYAIGVANMKGYPSFFDRRFQQ